MLSLLATPGLFLYLTVLATDERDFREQPITKKQSSPTYASVGTEALNFTYIVHEAIT